MDLTLISVALQACVIFFKTPPLSFREGEGCGEVGSGRGDAQGFLLITLSLGKQGLLQGASLAKEASSEQSLALLSLQKNRF